ncbi:MAG TPA: hypothetical protein PLR20_14845 [Syntrophales bacterium]|nr:hypothetical protein [Syntrophales bacterium]
MFGRIASALELIAVELSEIKLEIRAMRQDQKDLVSMSRQEMEKGPDRVMEIFQKATALIGGDRAITGGNRK